MALFGGLAEPQSHSISFRRSPRRPAASTSPTASEPAAKGLRGDHGASQLQAEPDDFNEQIIEEFRANEGRVSGPLAGTPVILIHHIGAKSGGTRVTPLVAPRSETAAT